MGLAPEQILAAPEHVQRGIVVGPRLTERVQRLRRCAELAVAGAPWRAYQGIGKPGADRTLRTPPAAPARARVHHGPVAIILRRSWTAGAHPIPP